MRKITVITLVIVMLIVSAVPALAAGGPPSDRGTGSGSCTGDQTRMQLYSQASLGSGKQPSFGLRTPYALSGTISVIDQQAQTVTVLVSCGNRLANPYIGSEVILQTTPASRFLLRNEDGTVTPITIADLMTGETVSSHGALVDGIWTPSRVTTGALLNCLP